MHPPSAAGRIPGPESRFRRRLWTITGVCAVVFGVLLVVRLGGLSPPSAPAPTFAHTDELAAHRETWFAIYRDQRHIGYTHRLWRPSGDGFSTTETTVLVIAAMGMTQRLRLYATADLGPDLRLSTFQFQIASRQFRFAVSGTATPDQLSLRIGEGSDAVVPLNGPVYVMSGLMPAVAAQSLVPGKAITVPVFDPSVVASAEIQVTFLGKSRLPDTADPAAYRHYRLRYNRMDYEAWVDDHGSLVRESGALGMTLVRTTRAEAVAVTDDGAAVDLTEWAAIRPDRPIASPDTRNRLTLEVTGLPTGLAVNGDRQQQNGQQITIIREPGDVSANRPTTAPDAQMRSASPLVQADHPEIRAAAAALAHPTNPEATARSIVEWVYAKIAKKPVLSIPDALTTLRRKEGDCNEHAVLVAALGRAAGIATRIEAGLVYTRGRFFYHAWNAFYLDSAWVTADAVLNQMPADVTHLRLVIGDPDRHVDLLPVIGRLAIAVEDTAP